MKSKFLVSFSAAAILATACGISESGSKSKLESATEVSAAGEQEASAWPMSASGTYVGQTPGFFGLGQKVCTVKIAERSPQVVSWPAMRIATTSEDVSLVAYVNFERFVEGKAKGFTDVQDWPRGATLGGIVDLVHVEWSQGKLTRVSDTAHYMSFGALRGVEHKIDCQNLVKVD